MSRKPSSKAARPERKLSPVSVALRNLRLKAGYSIRGLARAAGMADSSYSSYESDRYKKDYIPPDLIAKIKPPLLKRGVSEQELLPLMVPAGDMPKEIEGGATPEPGATVTIGRPKAVRVLYDVAGDLALLHLTESSGRVYEVPLHRAAALALRDQLSKLPER